MAVSFQNTLYLHRSNKDKVVGGRSDGNDHRLLTRMVSWYECRPNRNAFCRLRSFCNVTLYKYGCQLLQYFLHQIERTNDILSLFVLTEMSYIYIICIGMHILQICLDICSISLVLFLSPPRRVHRTFTPDGMT